MFLCYSVFSILNAKQPVLLHVQDILPLFNNFYITHISHTTYKGNIFFSPLQIIFLKKNTQKKFPKN